MALPPVVIELSQSDAGSPNAAALVEACSAAVSDGECRVGPDSSTARAVVIVSWDPEHRRAHIEIGVPQDGKNRWSSRELDFREADPEPERWKAVGLVVGTLVSQAERERESAAPPPPATAPPPPAAAVRRPAPPSPAPTRLWLGAELAAGPAMDDGTWRLGPGLIGVYDVPGERVLAAASVRYMLRPADEQGVDARWLGIGIGVGLHHEPTAEWRLEGRTEAVLERMDATLSATERDSGGRWLPGMRIGIGTARRFDRWGALTVGLEATGLSRGTLVSLRGERVGRAPPLTWDATVGFRFGLF